MEVLILNVAALNLDDVGIWEGGGSSNELSSLSPSTVLFFTVVDLGMAIPLAF